LKAHWGGVFPAVTTQFREDFSLDIDATGRVMEGLIRDGVSGLVVCGTVGENCSLEKGEKIAVMEAAKAVARGRVPVVSGIAEFTSAFAIDMAKQAARIGLDGVMVMPALVYSSKPQETAAHFRSVAKATDLPVDVHLMIMEPDKFAADFAKAGADYITVHAEVLPHLNRSLALIRELGVKAGVALNPSTPLSALDWVWDSMDMLLVMSVNPGFGGQEFIPNCMKKISAARAEIDRRGLGVLLEVDGGIKVDNAGAVARAGAEILVAGSAVFGTADYAKTVAAFRDAVTGARI